MKIKIINLLKTINFQAVFKLFDFSLKISGFPIDEARLEFDNILEIPEANYESYILGRRKQIVDFHLKNNTFYSQLASGKTSDQWDALPILTKKNCNNL